MRPCTSLPLLLLLLTPTAARPQHQPNFDTERKQANDLFLAGKSLQALPLYADLAHQDPTMAVFAERHAAGLISRGSTLPDGPEKTAVQQQAMAELLRAQSLGDNSPYLQAVLGTMAKTPLSSAISGIPLTIGYKYKGSAPAQVLQQQGEAAFATHDFDKALELYKQAAQLDPRWYEPFLDTGDVYFRKHDPENAALWFAKATAVDPDRDTAWRYWGDALYRSGDSAGARLKYEQAIVAEPYARTSWIALSQWAQATHIPINRPVIDRPAFTTSSGVLDPDPALIADTTSGRASWLVYQHIRVAHGAPTLNQLIVAGAIDANGILHPSGYRHSLAEEHEALTAMLSDLQQKLTAHTLNPVNLDSSLKLLLRLQKDDMLDCWILLNPDAGILHDYPDWRATHRELLVAYIDRYVIAPTA